MPSNVEREIRITEHEFEILQRALQQLAKRTIANANQTTKGYGTATSMTKRDELLDYANECQELESKLAEIFI